MKWHGMASREQVPFRRIFEPLERPVPKDAGIVTAFTDGQVTLRSNRSKIGYHEAKDLSGFQGVEPGDFVVHGLDILRGSVGVSDSRGALSAVCTVCRPIQQRADPRFMSYVMRVQAESGLTRAMARGVREGGADFRRWGTLAELPLPLVDRDEQRRIADFLDDRVSRIDRIIAARREQAGKVDEWLNSSALDLLGTTDPYHGAPLSARALIIDTEHKTAPSEPGGGYWIAGTNAIRDGRIVRGNLRETDQGSFIEWTKRGRPAPGDVVLTREAPVGEVALLGEEDRRIAIGQRVVLLKPNHHLLIPGFLRLLLMVGPVVRVIDQASDGSLHPHLNMSDISRLRIPDVDVGEQVSLATQHEELLVAGTNRSAELAQSIDLLTEYKSSLITAAVTGELDVSTAGSSIPG